MLNMDSAKGAMKPYEAKRMRPQMPISKTAALKAAIKATKAHKRTTR